ncbi:hypothetical protein J6590_078816 [Homalodisca vitripennis]|nr:hypothetical protein J6590_078816 [Homalodisca vitripennis]
MNQQNLVLSLQNTPYSTTLILENVKVCSPRHGLAANCCLDRAASRATSRYVYVTPLLPDGGARNYISTELSTEPCLSTLATDIDTVTDLLLTAALVSTSRVSRHNR